MQPSAPPFDERLTAPRSWWFIAFGVGVACGLMLLPLGTLPLLAGLVGGTAAAALVVSGYGSARIRVVAGSLVAGDARIPLSALGEPEVLDAEEARAWRTHRADARAFTAAARLCGDGGTGGGHGSRGPDSVRSICPPATRGAWRRR